MPDANVVAWIREKYTALISDLDECGHRRWAATEARALGRGGIAAVAQATGMSDRTIRNGIAELTDPQSLSVDRQRRPGGGRSSREEEQPELVNALQGLVDDSTRGDPMSPLRWTCKSTRVLAAELNNQGYQISSTKVGELLRSQGCSLHGNRKTIEGKQHPDRDAQFQHIAKRAKAFQRTGQPVISVDTKKKEPLGNMKNAGKTYRKKGDPVRVTTHDFPDKELGKAVPYGVYDVTRACKGVPLESVDAAKHYIENTETIQGLSVVVRVMDKVYEIGRKYAKDFKKTMTIRFDKYLPKWNYTAIPDSL